MNNVVRGRNGKAVRAAVYARVSTDEQATEGTSIGTQLERCRKTITDKDWIPSGEFVDEGVSGSKGSRPALDKLMEECRSGRVNAIVVSKLDRFTRSLAHLSSAIDELDNLGVAFVSVAESFDASTISGQAMAGMLGVFAQMERRTIAERGASGQRARVSQGLWPGGTCPFGLTTMPNPNGSGHLSILHPDESETVRLAARLLVEDGMTTGQAAARLNVLGLKPRKAVEWTHYSLRRTMENPNLHGEYIWGKDRSRHGVVGSAQGRHGPPVPVTIPQVLTDEEWENVQTALNAKRLGKRLTNKVYPLSGHLLSECGSTYHGAWRSDRQSREYWCKESKRTPVKTERCHCPRLKALDVEAVVFAEVIRLMTDPKRLQQLAAERLAIVAPKNDVAAQLAEVDRRISALNRKLEATLDKALEDDLSAAAMVRVTERLTRDLHDLEEHREGLMGVADQVEQAQSAVDRLTALASKGRRALEDMDLTNWTAVISLMALRIEVLTDGETKGAFRLRIAGRLPHAALADQLESARQLGCVDPPPDGPRRR